MPLYKITQQKSDKGELTIKQVAVGTDRVLPNSKFKITPNPIYAKGFSDNLWQ